MWAELVSPELFLSWDAGRLGHWRILHRLVWQGPVKMPQEQLLASTVCPSVLRRRSEPELLGVMLATRGEG